MKNTALTSAEVKKAHITINGQSGSFTVDSDKQVVRFTSRLSRKVNGVYENYRYEVPFSKLIVRMVLPSGNLSLGVKGKVSPTN